MARICLIDDKELIRDSLEEILCREHHAAAAFEDPEKALEAIRRGEFDLVITDLKMPRMDGIALIRALRERQDETPIIVMTAYGTVGTAVEAMKLGACDYIQKPFEAEAISVVVERALQNNRLLRENEALRASIGDLQKPRIIVGEGKSMVLLRQRIERVADSQATVLITGESGTGKELVARAVHAESPRNDSPMLCLNCAALSANLLESELFGHERGAFTGADRTRKGRFELADGGTLLLDEISEMALPLQAKFLRVLQEGEFERVGSSTTRRADVRVIATTNRNLGDWVARKRFRSDLYYRLNVLPLVVPPLRERLEDVADLVRHFLSAIACKEGKKPTRLDAPAIALMRQYAWPGNVRELENLCQRTVAMFPEAEVSAARIDSWLTGGAQSVQEFSNLRYGRMIEDAERQLIEKTLSRHGGHRANTAKALGIGIRTLGMKLKQWREEAQAMERGGAALAAAV